MTHLTNSYILISPSKLGFQRDLSTSDSFASERASHSMKTHPTKPVASSNPTKRSRLGSFSLMGISLVMIFSCLATPTFGDIVELLDNNKKVEGNVIDLGGNSIAVIQSHGRRKIHKGDILRVVYSLDKKPQEARTTDLVIRTNGQDLEGKARYTKDSLFLRVEMENGNVVSVPANEVAKVIYSGQNEDEFNPSLLYTQKTEDLITQEFKKLNHAELLIREGAVRRLKAIGYFAVEKVKERIYEIEDQLSPINRETKEQRALLEEKALLQEIYLTQVIRAKVPHKIEKEKPSIYKIILDGDSREKSKLMDWLFTAFPKESVPLARVLLDDSKQDTILRARIIGFFQGLQLNLELLDAYRQSTGKIQLALSIALGKNRILVGVPTLIEALSFEDAIVRKLAFENLKEMTGIDNGYHPHDLPSTRRHAINKWRAWWQTHKDTVLQQAEAILSGKRVDTPQRKEARELWLKANEVMDSDQLKLSESFLKQAILRDPTFINAHVQLAFLYYSSLNRPEEAKKILNSLVTKPLPGVHRESLTWVHYHLGKIAEQEKNDILAQKSYERAFARDASFFRAAIALADVNYRLATRDRKLTIVERKDRLTEVIEYYNMASKIIDEHQDGLELLYQENLPLDGGEYFDLRAHNSRVNSVKSSMRVAKAKAHLGIARVQALLAQRRKAMETLTLGIDILGKDKHQQAKQMKVELRNYLALLFEGQGNFNAAFAEYKKVIRDLDSTNQVAQRGLRRTQRQITRRDTNFSRPYRN